MLHSVKTYPVNQLGPVWNPHTNDWEARTLSLPLYRGRPVLLVPKFSVRHRLSLDSQEFYNHYMINFLQSEYLRADSALVQVLKDGKRRVTKKSVKDRHPFLKDDLAEFVREHPDVLETYKNIKGAAGPLDNEDLEACFDEQAFAGALREKLLRVPPGGEAASQYHSLAVGFCTFLFHPNLIYPVKEKEIHEGRKRIDIKYANAAKDGFFLTMLQSQQARAISVAIECKNYTTDIKNPELDQLTGRFGHQRGFFGLLLCRKMKGRDRIISKCRDAANDGRGFILVLEDRDLVEMLDAVGAGQRARIDRLLRQRFSDISD